MVSINITVLLATLSVLSATKGVLIRSDVKKNNHEKLKSQLTEGREARLGEYPWMVALHKEAKFLCGSFLVTSKFVMTAAHCVVFGKKANDPKLYKGYIGTINRGGPDTEITFKEIIAHPEYSGCCMENDIALLKLTQPLKLSENIQTICLPAKNFISENMTVELVGWRVSIKRAKKYPKTLQTVKVKVITNSKCALIYANSGANVTQKQICARSENGKVFCSMVTGSALVAMNENKPVAIGIVSFGSPSTCIRYSIPIVFTATSLYTDWVMKSMGDDAKELCFISKGSTNIRRWGSEPLRIFYMST